MIPVICIDGPSASGKGTVALRVAQHLGFHYLDSGLLYRVLGCWARRQGVAWDDACALVPLARDLPLRFAGEQVWLADEEISAEARSEMGGAGASQVAVWPEVRTALLARQRQFCQPPGLVADGRDMGTVVFPESSLKVFLTASAEVRAQRRTKQLMDKGSDAIFAAILQDLQARDARDANRAVAPLQAAQDAQVLDCSAMGIDEVVQTILAWWQQRQHA